MNLTLHLTESCNLACSYCTRTKSPMQMSEVVLDAACHLIFTEGSSAGLCFFGGEPMLAESLIYRALDNCIAKSAETGISFFCKMTTNGTLLNESFLQRAKEVGMRIGLSFDGTAQNLCRRFPNGKGSFALLEQKALLLLHALPNSTAMMTIAPQAAGQFSDAVKYLYNLGFRNINATIAYGKNVRWDDIALELLHQQMNEIAVFYRTKFFQKTPFYFSPLDSKIREAISGFQPAERCHLGLRQMPVAPDGRLYACTQFIGDSAYLLGDVFNGIDPVRRQAIAAFHAEPAICKSCGLRTRCTHTCGCLNRLETGSAQQVSPLQCSYERMLIALADETADTLYAEMPAQFAQHFVDSVCQKQQNS